MLFCYLSFSYSKFPLDEEEPAFVKPTLDSKPSSVALIKKYDFADNLSQEDLAKIAWDGTDLETFIGKNHFHEKNKNYFGLFF